jgi:hypothetical protein
VDPPPGWCPQVFVVVPQVPDQIGDLISRHRPVVRDTGDPAQGVVGAVAWRVDLADNRMFGACHRDQCCHRGADTLAAMVGTHRLQRVRRVRYTQFGCVREQFDHIVEAAVIDC